MEALHGLQAAEAIDLLITRVRFPEGTPHGLSLALMARYRRPGINVLFAARPDMEKYAKALGELIRYPVDISDLVENVIKLLERPGDCGVSLGRR
jgi:hypothetical protein